MPEQNAQASEAELKQVRDSLAHTLATWPKPVQPNPIRLFAERVSLMTANPPSGHTSPLAVAIVLDLALEMWPDAKECLREHSRGDRIPDLQVRIDVLSSEAERGDRTFRAMEEARLLYLDLIPQAEKVEAQDRQASESAGAPMATIDNARPTESAAPDLVTLDESAAIVHKSKKTLEGYKAKGTLPAPRVKGGKGKPSLWDWEVMRFRLEANFVPDLPARFPRNVR